MVPSDKDGLVHLSFVPESIETDKVFFLTEPKKERNFGIEKEPIRKSRERGISEREKEKYKKKNE